MAKPQYVATAVVLAAWGKLKGASSLDEGTRIEAECFPPRRARGVAVCQHRSVSPRHIAVSIGAAAVATSVLQAAPIPLAQAAPCPDAEVVFARGTTEAPGPGPTGDASPPPRPGAPSACLPRDVTPGAGPLLMAGGDASAAARRRPGGRRRRRGGRSAPPGRPHAARGSRAGPWFSLAPLLRGP